MRAANRNSILVAGAFLFTVIPAIVLLRYPAYADILLYAAIALSLAVLLAFTDYSPVLGLLFMSLPLSVEVALGGGENKMLTPSEPIIILLGLTYGILVFFRSGMDREFLRHPATRCILLYLAVMLLTSLTSSMPVVSFKFLLVNAAYIFIFYFLVYDFLKKKESNAVALYFMYGVTMLYVVIRALYLHSTTGFYQGVAGLVVHPFFIDHTGYSAAIAMLVPGFIAFGLRGRAFRFSRIVRLLCFGAALILMAALFFSYCRAAWISAGAALLFYGMLRLRITPKQLGVLFIGLIAVALVFRDPIIQSFKMNRHSSTELNSDLTDATLSVTNISNDASNAERVNRWSCAWRMFLDKPITGFGPGTYQFQYLSYQRPDEMTRISVTTPYNNGFGRGGSAHSEYLLALSESGVGGFVLYLLVIVFIVRTGMRAYYAAADERSRLLAAVALTGFITYAVHTLFNNFLNNNKDAGLFWMLAAIVVMLERRSANQPIMAAKAI